MTQLALQLAISSPLYPRQPVGPQRIDHVSCGLCVRVVRKAMSELGHYVGPVGMADNGRATTTRVARPLGSDECDRRL